MATRRGAWLLLAYAGVVSSLSLAPDGRLQPTRVPTAARRGSASVSRGFGRAGPARHARADVCDDDGFAPPPAATPDGAAAVSGDAAAPVPLGGAGDGGAGDGASDDDATAPVPPGEELLFFSPLPPEAIAVRAVDEQALYNGNNNGAGAGGAAPSGFVDMFRLSAPYIAKVKKKSTTPLRNASGVCACVRPRRPLKTALLERERRGAVAAAARNGETLSRACVCDVSNRAICRDDDGATRRPRSVTRPRRL